MNTEQRLDRLERQCERLMSYSETQEGNLLKLVDIIDAIKHQIGEWTEFMTIITLEHEVEAHKFEKLSSAKRIRESIEDIDKKYNELFTDIQTHFQIPHSKKKDTMSREGTDYL